MNLHRTRNVTLAMTLALLTASAGKVSAQSTTTLPPPPSTTPAPSSVTGTNPEPKSAVVEMLLALLHLA